MSADTRHAVPQPQVDQVIEAPAPPPRELETQRQRAARARRHASAIGDYAAAESWHRQERIIDAQLAAREQPESHA